MSKSMPLSSDNELPGYSSTVTNGSYDQTDDYQNKDDVYLKISNWFKQWKSHASDWRKEAIQDYDFYSLEQWEEEARTAMEDRSRIPIVMDRTAPVINMVCGLEVNSRQESTYYARTEGVAQQNELLNGAAMWAREGCDAEDEESDAFKDLLICGMGFSETRMDLDTDPDGMIVEERIDPLEMWWDASATKKNLKDARFLGRVRKWNKEDVKDAWPDAEITSDGAPWNDMEMIRTQPHDATLAPYYKDNQAQYASDPDEWAVCHVQWKEKEDVVRFVDPLNGKITYRKEEDFNAISERIVTVQQMAGQPIQPLKGFKMKRQIVWQAFICGKTVLEVTKLGAKESPTSEFTFNPLTGYRNRNRRTWYGLMRAMKDPQRWSNKIYSEILYIIGSQSKGGIMIEEDAVDNITDLEQRWTDPSGLVVLRPGSIAQGKIKERPVGQVAPAFNDLLQQAITAIPETTGINTAAMGQSTDDHSGYLEYQRRQSAVTVLAPFFDALRLFRKQQGRVLLYFIQNYISDNRLIRIEGNMGQEQYVKLDRSQTLGEYDVIVDESPYSPNQKEKNWAVLQQILPMAKDLGVPIPPQMILELPISEKLKQTWMQYIQQQQGKPNPMEQATVQEKQASANLKQVQAQKAKSEILDTAGRLQSDSQEAQSRAVLNYAQAKDVADAGHLKKFDTVHNAIMDMKDQHQEDAQHRLDHQNTQLNTLNAHHTVRKDQASLDQGQQALDKPQPTGNGNGQN